MLLSASDAVAGESAVRSPDGKIAVVVSDSGGLQYRVEVDGAQVLAPSRLGLEFKNHAPLGPTAGIVKAETIAQKGNWENPFGNRRIVPENCNELRLSLKDSSSAFGLIVRVYDDGIALRYDLPEASALGEFVLTNELTEFCFTDNHRCWYGEESGCAENQYPQSRLSDVPAKNRDGHPYNSVLPLLVQTPNCFVTIAESDLLDWAGMFLSGTGGNAVKATLASRIDGNGLVVSRVPRVSPWRVIIIGRSASALAGSDLIATLATPNRIGDASWVKPGVAAWDAWWTGVNTNLPQYKGVDARGDTKSHMEYIDLAAEMGWEYQVVDWFWYQNMTSFNKALHSRPNSQLADFTKSVPEIDLPNLVAYAKSKNVRLIVWAHSLDVKTFGIEKTFEYFSGLGVAGTKIDFLNSDSQETVQWSEQVLGAAAKNKLLVDFHGMYKPTGLARTYPNFITQEGVLGNEYNKLGGNRCTPLHTVTLPFTRALLGPMDFTPGGFLNRDPKDFKITSPAQVMGTRCRQLAMTIIYPSPLQVMCDSPANYRNQPGVEFLRDLPTVWDDSVVLAGEVGQSIVLARRSGETWYLAAMNGDAASSVKVPLNFLSPGRWTLSGFADVEGDPQGVEIHQKSVEQTTEWSQRLAPAGGFAGKLTQEQ